MIRKSIGKFQRVILNTYSIVDDSKRFQFGRLGKGCHTRIFRIDEFRKNLAPKNAEIKSFEVDGENFIRMRY